jgi:hypothetical protein
MTACADVAQAMLKELAGSMPRNLLAADRRREPPCDVLPAVFAVNPEFRLQPRGKIYCRLRTNSK